MFNSKINSMFIGDFIEMIKNDIGENQFSKMIKEIGWFSSSEKSIREFKNRVSDWQVKEGYCIF